MAANLRTASVAEKPDNGKQRQANSTFPNRQELSPAERRGDVSDAVIGDNRRCGGVRRRRPRTGLRLTAMKRFALGQTGKPAPRSGRVRAENPTKQKSKPLRSRAHRSQLGAEHGQRPALLTAHRKKERTKGSEEEQKKASKSQTNATCSRNLTAASRGKMRSWGGNSEKKIEDYLRLGVRRWAEEGSETFGSNLLQFVKPSYLELFRREHRRKWEKTPATGTTNQIIHEVFAGRKHTLVWRDSKAS